MLAKSGGYSRPAERLGAHIALVLNTPGHDGLVQPNAFDLWRRLTQLLSHHSGYRWPLLGVASTSPNSAEQVAIQWIDLVLDAERQTHAGRDHHNGHILIDHLCARCGATEPSRLTRGEVIENAVGSSTILAVSERLEAWNDGRKVACHKKGPAGLSLAKQRPFSLPEALSLWGALKCGPSGLDPLDDDAELQLVHFMARACHGANKHWEMLVRLRFHPPDWICVEEDAPLSTLTTNQARLAVKFVQTAQIQAGDGAPNAEDWAAAWAIAPIMQSMNFETFSQSPVGRHLMSSGPVGVYQVETDLEQLPAIEDGPVASAQDAQAALGQLKSDGHIDQRDLDLCAAVIAGQNLNEIFASSPEYQSRFGSFDDFVDHSDKVAEQIAYSVEQRAFQEADD